MKEVVIIKDIPKTQEEKHKPETGIADGDCLNNTIPSLLAFLNFDQHLSLAELISTVAEAQDQPSLHMLFLLSRVLHGRPLWISVSKLFVSYMRPHFISHLVAISVCCLVPVLAGSMQGCLEQMSHPISQFLISPGTLVCNNN